MLESRKGLSLTAITFAISLYSKLQREMGLKSAKDVGLSFLSIKARKVELSEGVIYPEVLAKSMACNNSEPSRSKKWR